MLPALKPEEEVVGVYKELRITTDSIVIVLQLAKGKEVEVSFPVELVKPEIIRKKFRSIKIGEKIGILRITDAKRPVLIRKIRHGKGKRATIYVGVELYERLEKYQEPCKSIVTAVEKLLDIVEKRETIVVIMNRGEISCNRMKRLREPNRVYCRMLETIVTKEYCTQKCIVAPHIEELSKRTEQSKTKATPSLDSFLQLPKIEHLRTPPKIEKDRCRSCWVFGVFLRFLECCSKTVGLLITLFKSCGGGKNEGR